MEEGSKENKITFWGRAANDKNTSFVVAKYIKEASQEIPDGYHEIENNEGRIYAQRMCREIVDYGRDELGIDLSDRIPKVDQIHFFAPPFYKTKLERIHRNICEILQHKQEDRGRSGPYFTAIIVEDSKSNGKDFQIVHELVHDLSQRKVEVVDQQGEPGIGRVTAGLRTVNDSFECINEALTQFTALDVMRETADAAALRNKRGEIESSYSEELVFLDRLTSVVAEKVQVPRAEIIKILQCGMFNNEIAVLRIIKDALGSKALDRIVKYEYGDGMAKLARDVGLGDISEAMISISGSGTKIFEDVVEGGIKVRMDIFGREWALIK